VGVCDFEERLHLGACFKWRYTAAAYIDDRLPDDIFNMSKLRRITLQCSHVLKIESKFS
jgi:hypothetical protein